MTMIREATGNMETGISVGGRIINTIRYADDKAVVANSQKGLQQLMDNLNKVTREFSMKINVKKTKVMCISRKGNNKLKIYVDGQQVEQVSQLRYLGSLISEDGSFHPSIHHPSVYFCRQVQTSKHKKYIYRESGRREETLC